MHAVRKADWPFARQTPSLVVLRWLTRSVLVPFAIFAGFSGYRAWVQVRRVALHVPDLELRPGDVIAVDAVSWARATVTVRLIPLQGAHAETLAVHRIPSNHVASLDPRTRSAHLLVPIERERLSRFRPGGAVLRAHAIGAPQWLRIPPPKVQEVAVRIPLISPVRQD
jgi:hypothetical protein